MRPARVAVAMLAALLLTGTGACWTADLHPTPTPAKEQHQ